VTGDQRATLTAALADIEDTALALPQGDTQRDELVRIALDLSALLTADEAAP
jgi:hypothetical protein